MGNGEQCCEVFECALNSTTHLCCHVLQVNEDLHFSEEYRDDSPNDGLDFYARAAMEADAGGSKVEMAACNVCGRNFARDRLAKHEKICQGSTNKKRRVFDMSKMRTQGTEMAKFYNPRKPMKPPPKVAPSRYRFSSYFSVSVSESYLSEQLAQDSRKLHGNDSLQQGADRTHGTRRQHRRPAAATCHREPQLQAVSLLRAQVQPADRRAPHSALQRHQVATGSSQEEKVRLRLVKRSH